MISPAQAALSTPNNWYQSLEVLHPAAGRHLNHRITHSVFCFLYLMRCADYQPNYITDGKNLNSAAIDHYNDVINDALDKGD